MHQAGAGPELHELRLEVASYNHSAIDLYRKPKFTEYERTTHILSMQLSLAASTHHDNMRDYDQELKDTSDHKYAYGFDFDVMHGYMLDSFTPFFREGSTLELGSFKGDFTVALPPFRRRDLRRSFR